METQNQRLELVKQYQNNPEKYQDNIIILWNEIGHIISSGFYKKWSKWSVFANFSWEDAKQDLMVGFMEAIMTYNFNGTYEIGKWLYIKSLSYASYQTLKLLNKKNSVLNTNFSLDKNTNFIENIYFKTNNIEDIFFDKMINNSKNKALSDCLEFLYKNKKLKLKIEIFGLKIQGKSIKEIAQKFKISISDVKNSLFTIRKKIKEYLLKNSPELFEKNT